MRSAAVFSSQASVRSRRAAHAGRHSLLRRTRGSVARAAHRSAAARGDRIRAHKAPLRHAPRRERPLPVVPRGFLPLVRH